MSPEPTLSLSRRAVACPGWRWMTGMLDTDGNRIIDVWTEDDEPTVSFAWPSGVCASNVVNGVAVDVDIAGPHFLPDLADPATLGCLLALVREAWGDPECHYMTSARDGWLVWRGSCDHGLYIGKGETEAEALVCALEAAPR